MYVKMVGDGGGYRIWQQVQEVAFFPAMSGHLIVPGEWKISVTLEDKFCTSCDITGEVFVMNDQGKTIDKFNPAELPNLPATTVRVMPEHLRGQLPVSDAPGLPPLKMEVALTTEEVIRPAPSGGHPGGCTAG